MSTETECVGVLVYRAGRQDFASDDDAFEHQLLENLKMSNRRGSLIILQRYLGVEREGGRARARSCCCAPLLQRPR